MRRSPLSHRPIKDKQLRRLRRALRKAGAPPASLDLIDWLKTRGHAQTTGEAVRMLIDGKVSVDSHVVGRLEYFDAVKDEDAYAIAPLIGAHHRGNIVVRD